MLYTADRHARRATAIVFFVTGAVFGSFASRIPALQERLDLPHGELALVFLALNAGAVAGLPGGGVLASRLGSRAALRLGYAVFPPALVAAGLAPSLASLCLAVAVLAAANSVIDVAMNVQGVEIERRFGRPILSGLHAAHSIGVLGGGAAGLAAAAGGLSVLAHFSAAAAPAALWGFAATGGLIDERARRVEHSRRRPSGPVVALGLLLFCALMCEGAANDWSAVHLRSAHAVGEALAAAAFVAFSLALALGRLAGDRVVAVLGRAHAVQAGALVAAGGLGLAITASAVAPALAGWAVFGAGLSLIAPTIIGAAPTAIAAVSACGYLGAFAGPPLVGALTEWGSLSAALGVIVGAAAAIALLAPRTLPP